MHQQLSKIPFSFLSTQTCTNCQLPVTCGPVYVINDLSILCGRCRMTAKDHYRNYVYEALASTFIYPCKNWRNHCPVSLPWNDSLDHENDCNYIGCCTFICSHPGAFLKGKRDMPRDEIRLTVVPENLLEHLECVLCSRYLNSVPVYIQSNGQNICHRCIHANGNPPNCRRNYAYENFSQIFIFPCTYKKRGCRERMQFGRVIWQHESKCEYGPNMTGGSPTQQEWNSMEPVRQSLRPSMIPNHQQRPSERQEYPQRPSIRPQDPERAFVHQNEEDLPRPSVSPNDQQRPSARPIKEKGLVKIQSGQYVWATLTPNKVEEMNKKLIKSYVEKQKRQIRRVDDIEHQMGRRNSDSESTITDESFRINNSGTSTPELLDPSRRPYIPPEDYNLRDPRGGDSRPNSRESGVYSEEHRYSNQGHFPVLKPHQLSDGFDSIKRVSKRESSRGNPLLINELKIKQDIIKRTHSIKGEKDMPNPYKQSNNLADILEVNRQLK